MTSVQNGVLIGGHFLLDIEFLFLRNLLPVIYLVGKDSIVQGKKVMKVFFRATNYNWSKSSLWVGKWTCSQMGNCRYLASKYRYFYSNWNWGYWCSRK